MDVRDEFFHEPPDDIDPWSESYYFDVNDEDCQAFVRLGFYPNRRETSLWVYVFTDDGAYGRRERRLDAGALHGLTAGSTDWRLTVTPDEPGDTWRVFYHGALEPLDVADGDAVTATIDAEWRGRCDSFYYSDGRDFPAGDAFDRYEQPCDVTGLVEIADGRVPIDGAGERDHSWGRREWSGDVEWVWTSGAFDDGASFNPFSYRFAGAPQDYVNGFWCDGDEVHAVDELTVEATPALGPETARAWRDGDLPTLRYEIAWSGGSATVEATPTDVATLAWDDGGAVLNRSPVLLERDGASGRGFVEHMQGLGEDAP